MTKKNLLIGVSIILGIILLAKLVGAAPAPKYFVCKYVGTPNVDERLQTGNNPISVSGNALPNGTQVGDSFADAQGRSYVVAEDTGQDEPECPVPDNPPEEEPPEEEPEEPVDIDPHQDGLTPDQPTPMRENNLAPIVGK